MGAGKGKEKVAQAAVGEQGTLAHVERGVQLAGGRKGSGYGEPLVNRRLHAAVS
jgi:hypothetical protein